MTPPATKFSRTKVKRGNQIVNPLNKPATRLRPESITVTYKSDPDWKQTDTTTKKHRLRPGTTLKEQTEDDDTPTYYLFLGVSEVARDCLYFLNLNQAPADDLNTCLKRLDKTAWITDYEAGYTDIEPVPYEEAIDKTAPERESMIERIFG